MGTPIPPIDRFHRHVERVGDCLIWTGTVGGSTSKSGYFQSSTDRKVTKVRAHRWIYEYHFGPIPEGYEIDHVRARGCSGSMCVEISHLEAVTHVENMRRARLDVCRSGRHDLTIAENVRWDSQGRRRGCLLCRQESQRDWHKKGSGSTV